MNYDKTLKYIHSVNNYFCKPGLERIKQLCSYLGNPQDSLKFVHVAGTNGKGSFCALMTSILMEAGYKVGTYTSPYILEFNERISINREMISNDDLVEICEYVKPFCEKMTDKPTEFELITAIAFEYFNRQKCDIVVLECGLGGKFDATNIINNSILSVITGVDFDHQNFLGDTIEQIASEKAGIIKQDTPCLWCGNNNSAYKVIHQTANDKNSKIFTPDYKKLEIVNFDLSGTTFNYKKLKDFELPLLSTYQPYNAANAITAAEILTNNGLSINEDNVRNGIKNAIWKARFEVLSTDPLIIFDGAHNPQGINSAIQSIKTYFGDKKVNILTGVMKDKDYGYIANAVGSVANCVYCITPNNPRALRADEYSNVYKSINIPSLSFNDIKTALEQAVNDSKQNNIPLICLGSLYMYSDIYKLINS